MRNEYAARTHPLAVSLSIYLSLSLHCIKWNQFNTLFIWGKKNEEGNLWKLCKSRVCACRGMSSLLSLSLSPSPSLSFPAHLASFLALIYYILMTFSCTRTTASPLMLSWSRVVANKKGGSRGALLDFVFICTPHREKKREKTEEEEADIIRWQNKLGENVIRS